MSVRIALHAHPPRASSATRQARSPIPRTRHRPGPRPTPLQYRLPALDRATRGRALVWIWSSAQRSAITSASCALSVGKRAFHGPSRLSVSSPAPPVPTPQRGIKKGLLELRLRFAIRASFDDDPPAQTCSRGQDSIVFGPLRLSLPEPTRSVELGGKSERGLAHFPRVVFGFDALDERTANA